jgi:AraC-like DNA-binding protein
MRAAIARHLPNPDFDPDALADALAVSRSTLYRRARRADAPSPAHLIRTMRLERGAELLAEGAGTVSEVAYAVGFNSLAHFSRKFTNHFDQAPTEYVADADGR